ncbi:MAG: CusA/CzcA family heavy metal efflux RND transporter [Saprospiraceae bacterium]
MIDRIIHFSIHNKLVISLFVVGLIGWGVYSLQHLPIDAVPDITDNQVQVITNAPTLAAQEVEQLITFPLEMALGNVPDVVEVRSISRFGLSVITVVFEESTSVYLARQLIGERIKAAEAEIPKGLGQPEMSPISTGLGEIYQYVIYADEEHKDEFSSTELRSIQDWVVKRQLSGIKGVIEINSSGGYLKQYEVAFSPDKLKSMNVTLEELFLAIENNNANTGGSYIEKKNYTYFVRGEGRLNSMEDIENVVVKNTGGLPILIKDVAEVKIGHAPRFGAVTMNGIGEVVAGQVMMLKGENSAEVTERVKARMEQIKKSLPKGVIIEPYLDRSKLVNRTMTTVITNLVEGGLIVVFVLVLLLGNWRAGLIVASVIPLAMLFAISMMRVFGISANLMSLGAIDFGLVVDGAVIIVEAILHHLGIRKSGEQLSADEMNAEVYQASTKIRQSAAFGEIIILIVYLPILLLIGIEGKMFRPMAQTVSFAILGALILSLTYVPMMSSWCLKKKISNETNIADRIIGFLYKIYRPVLDFALKFKSVFLLATVAIFVISLLQFSRLGGEFIPTLEEGDFALHQILPPGSSIAKGVEVSAELQNILLNKFPEVEKVVTKIGTAEIPTDIMPLEAGDIFVILKPKSEWVSGSTKEELFEKMEMEMNKFPGVIYEFTQPIQMRFNELMTGVRQDIAIKLYGEDLGILAKTAKEAEHIIEEINGVGDIQVEATAGLQQMVAKYDRRKMARYGVSAEVINRTIRTGFAGEVAGHIFEGEKRFELVARLDEPYRNSIDDIKNLFIPLSNGDQIPLQELATIEFQEGPTQISRDNTQRRITIGVNTRGRDVESLVKEIKATLANQLSLPSGYYFTYGGAFENLENARARLMIAVPAALALIFVLLYLTFKSVTQSALIFTAIPMSAIGGIWALYFRGMAFSISAGVGFIALFGVAVLNGIVLIAYFNQLKKEGMKDLNKRILVGTKVRLRPVIMTATVASLGFLPMAISTSAGAEVQQPLATVVVGGLISATFLTLVILPILYYFSEKKWKMNKTTSLVSVLLLFFITGHSQVSKLSLEEAIAMSQQNFAVIKTNQLQIQRANKLSEIKSTLPATNIFITGEEFDFNDSKGIHSIGAQQNFYLPKVNQTQQKLYQQQASLAASTLKLTEQEIAYQTKLAFYDLVFQKQKQSFLSDLTEVYDDFVEVNQERFNAGSIGKLPLLTAQDQLKLAQWKKEMAKQDLVISNNNFRNWLRSEEEVDVDLEKLPLPTEIENKDFSNHPMVQFQNQNSEVAKAQIEVKKAQLLPQLQTGLRLQTVQGTAPFFGYQIGMNVPLFKKSQNKKIEAAQIQVQVQESKKEAILQQLEIQREKITMQLEKQKTAMEYLEKEILPSVRSRQEFAKSAFRAGQATALEYLQSLDQGIQYEINYLEMLKEYHFLKIQLDYLGVAK